MNNVEITLLGRVTLDQQYAELWTGTATVNDGTTLVVPVVPHDAIGTDLIVSVLSVDGGVNFASFLPVTPEATANDPSPVPRLERVSAVFGVFAGQPRSAPFRGTALGLSAVGTPLPA